MKLWRVFLVVSLLGSSGHFLSACSLCFSSKNPSIFDELQTAKAVALAWANPRPPHKVRGLQIIEGTLPPGEQEIPLEQSDKEQSKVVLYAFHGKYWKDMGEADEAAVPLIRHVLRKKTDWSQSPEQHLEYIAGFFEHEKRSVRKFAFAELARAPYSRIRSFAQKLSARELDDFLKNPALSDWGSLYILVFPHQEGEKHKSVIREKLPHLSKEELTYRLAPWTAALIELDQEKALPVIRECYVGRKIKPLEMDAIVQALSIHGNDGHQHLRPQIMLLYQELVKMNQRSTSDLIKDLHRWGKSELAQQVFTQTFSDYSPQEQLELRAFLRQPIAKNEENEKQAPATSGVSSSTIWLVMAVPVLLVAFQCYRLRQKASTKEPLTH